MTDGRAAVLAIYRTVQDFALQYLSLLRKSILSEHFEDETPVIISEDDMLDYVSRVLTGFARLKAALNVTDPQTDVRQVDIENALRFLASRAPYRITLSDSAYVVVQWGQGSGDFFIPVGLKEEELGRWKDIFQDGLEKEPPTYWN